MHKILRFTQKMIAVLLLAAALFGAGLAPVRTAAAAGCTPTVSFDLWAKTGTATLYGSTSVTVWGYALASGDPASVPGPVLDVPEGACVGVTLHNTLAESTSLLFQGQSMIPDTTGAAPAGTASYSFAADAPGTYLYEAGLIPGAQHQVAMGMYGTLIVRSATAGQAYDSAATAYDEEKVVVLSEYDTALAANPATFDMRKYAPKYFLINGKAYPGTADITVTAGNRVLLRYVNAGLQSHAMSLLGFSQTVLAQDGGLYNYPHKMAAETIAPGQTLDTIITPASTTPESSKFALYDANMLLRNNAGTGTNAGLGGMLAFLTVTGGSPTVGPDTVGPLLSSLSLSPNPSTGAGPVTLSFTANDSTTGNSNILAWEYSIDGGAPTPMTVASPAVVVNLSTVLPVLSNGTHLITVRARDVWGNWSMAGNINLVLDNVGPASSIIGLNPNPSSGSVAVSLSFTVNDGASGGSNVTAAEYWIDSGAHVAVPVGTPATLKTLTVSIPSGLSAGTHVVHVRGQDALGNWGPEAPTANLIVDKTGPLVTSVSATYNPNNGSKPLNTSVQAVRVTASLSDVSTGGSNLAGAEGFVDIAGATGSGFTFVASDGNFNSPAESGFADVPLVVINALSTGSHPFCVHAKDAAGNWGLMDCGYQLVIDRTPPAILSITRVDATPVASPATVHYLVTFSEAVTGVSTSNFSLVRTGLSASAAITSVSGGGTAWTVTATSGPGGGTLGLNLTSAAGITDLAGNALPSTGLPFVGQVYTVTVTTGQLYFSTTGTAVAVPGVGGTADDADIYFHNGTGGFSRVIDANGTGSLGLPLGANVDGFDRVDGTHFYMSFSGAVAVPGLGTVQDEDVVFYNAGTWSLFFDGSVNGVGGTDLDAISIVGGTLYFSTDSNTNPPGVIGTADDADIYRWNGGTSYTRMVDVTAAVGLPTGANTDGLVWVDSTHFYLSFGGTTTTVPTLGAVEDEDVVYYNAGTWSTYFDGTGVGLTDGSQDVDAFDLP